VILNSPAYKKDGLIVINFDEGGGGRIEQTSTGVVATVYGEFCCHQQEGPNLGKRYPVEATVMSHGRSVTRRTLNFGGDRTGALFLSKYIRPGTVSNVPYNHYSLLKSLEDIFGIHEYLGYAGQEGLVPFGPDVFTNN
jgi:hypothetical protein